MEASDVSQGSEFGLFTGQTAATKRKRKRIDSDENGGDCSAVDIPKMEEKARLRARKEEQLLVPLSATGSLPDNSADLGSKSADAESSVAVPTTILIVDGKETRVAVPVNLKTVRSVHGRCTLICVQPHDQNFEIYDDHFSLVPGAKYRVKYVCEQGQNFPMTYHYYCTGHIFDDDVLLMVKAGFIKLTPAQSFDRIAALLRESVDNRRSSQDREVLPNEKFYMDGIGKIFPFLNRTESVRQMFHCIQRQEMCRRRAIELQESRRNAWEELKRLIEVPVCLGLAGLGKTTLARRAVHDHATAVADAIVEDPEADIAFIEEMKDKDNMVNIRIGETALTYQFCKWLLLFCALN
jgi:hypothetical protein